MTGLERLRKVVDEMEVDAGCDELHRIHGDEGDRCDGRLCFERQRKALRIIADQIEREQRAGDTTVSAYDLLPEEDRDAAAWVREHGGLKSVKSRLDWVVGHCSTRQQLDFDFWLSGRVMHELGFEEDMADREEVERRLLARLMPEGMEWPKVDGKPVDFKTAYGPSLGVLEAVCIYSNGACEVMGHDGIIKGVMEIHVATPKVLDADGVEIRVGDKLYDTETGCGRTVRAINASGTVEFEGCEDRGWFTKFLTHRAPVLAADGRPLREGEMVYSIENGDEFTAIGIDAKSGDVHIRWGYDFEDKTGTIAAKLLTHERPVADTRERLEEDARSCTCVMEAIDLVRRAWALAERGA